jgi:hypothetical protein
MMKYNRIILVFFIRDCKLRLITMPFRCIGEVELYYLYCNQRSVKLSALAALTTGNESTVIGVQWALRVLHFPHLACIISHIPTMAHLC